MNIKSTKILLVTLLILLIVWKVIFSLFLADLDNAQYINYFVIILIVSFSLMGVFFLYHYTDVIVKSHWITGTLVLKKRGVFNTFNRAAAYDYTHKNYFKIIDENGNEHLLVGLFLPENVMEMNKTYTIKVRNKKILEIQE